MAETNTVEQVIQIAGTSGMATLAELEPNDWNPNRQDEATFAKELQSIRELGFAVPVIVCRIEGVKYEKPITATIVDGFHRWKAGGELGMDKVPVFHLGTVPRHRAMALTVILNELRGRPDAQTLGELLKEIEGESDLLAIMPYDDKELENLIALADVKELDLDELDKRQGGMAPDLLGGHEPRSTVAFELTAEQLHVVNTALALANEGAEPVTVGARARALELALADYISGAGLPSGDED